MTEEVNDNVGLDIWKKMEKLYGTDDFADISELKTITSGSLALDDALGPNWGLPMGRLIQYAGIQSSGKTLLSLIAIKKWQELNPNNWALFIDAELALETSWVEMLGVDLSRLRIMGTNDAVKIFRFLCGVPNKEYGKPKKKLGLLDMVAESGGPESTGLGIVVLDSIASIITPMEMGSAVGKINMALVARFLTDTLKKLVADVSRSGVVFIATNHVRFDPSKMWGDPTTTPGGNALKHHCSVMAHFLPLSSKETKILDDNGEIVGHTVRAKINKNKVGPPQRTCNIRIQYTKGIVDRNIEVGDLGVKYGVIVKPTSRSYAFDDRSFIGLPQLYNAMTEETADKVIERVKVAKADGIKPNSNVEEEEYDDNNYNEWEVQED